MTEIQRVFVQRGFRVGDKLPSERELASQLSVGRSTLREAMQGLQTMGLVNIRHGVGTFFASEPGKWLLQPLRFSESSPHRLFGELIEARLMVEVRLAALAAERATEGDIATLRRSLDKRAIAQRGEFNERGLDFHLAIAAAAHHTVLASMLTAVSHLYFDVLDSLGRSAQEAEYAFRARQQDGHEEILTRIEARDPQGAADAMRAHLRAVRAEFPSITEPSRAVDNQEEINE